MRNGTCLSKAKISLRVFLVLAYLFSNLHSLTYQEGWHSLFALVSSLIALYSHIVAHEIGNSDLDDDDTDTDPSRISPATINHYYTFFKVCLPFPDVEIF